MSEVSGPVVAIALILAAVFLPTAFIPGHHGPAVPAVRRDDRRLGDPLGFQRAHALAGALGAAAAAATARRVDRSAPSSAGSTASSAAPPTATCTGAACLIRKSARAMLLLAGVAVLAGVLGSRLPGGFLPEEDQGYLFLAVQLPNAASLQRTDAVCRQVEQILAATPGVRSYNTVVGFSLLSTASTHLQRLLLRHLRGVGRADGARGAIRRHQGARQPGAREAARGDRLRVPAARDPGRRHGGRRHLHARGPLGRTGRVPGGQHPAVPGGGAQAAGDRLGHHDASWRTFRRSSRRWTATRCSSRASRSRTSTRRSRPSWAVSSSTTSTASVAPGRSTCRPRASSARARTRWGSSTC